MFEVKLHELGTVSESEYTRVVCVCNFKGKWGFSKNKKRGGWEIPGGHIEPKEVKCNHCGAVLEYVPNDLLHWTYDKYYLICPVCRGNILRDNDGNYFMR